MPLYNIKPNSSIIQIRPNPFANERELQRLFEADLESLLGVRFIASEFTTGDRQRGRIDTLGLDQDGTPTIIEYKKTSKENIINQGLFYLDWLVDHKGDFALEAQKKFGAEIEIDWTRPRLILVAEDFSDYDKYAVNRIGANVELWAYRRYANDLLYLDPIFVAKAERTQTTAGKTQTAGMANEPEIETAMYSLEDHLKDKTNDVRTLFESLRDRVLALEAEGSIIEKANKQYISYKHGKNFCEIRPQANGLKVWVDISAGEINDVQKIARDVSNVGHWATGQMEFKVSELSELDYALGLIEQSYRLTV